MCYNAVFFPCSGQKQVQVEKMEECVTVITNPTVSVRVTSTLSSFEVNRRFNRGITIAEFKVLLPPSLLRHSRLKTEREKMVNALVLRAIVYGI